MKKKTIDKISLKVLYLEDSPRDIEIIRELLIDAGYDLSMDCAEKKKEFTSLLHHNKYDIILSDFKLPGFDAFGALKLVIDICPDVPFICVSGSIGEEIAIELIKQGAVDYILKDRLVRLPLAIKRALEEKKEKEERKRVEKELQWKTAFLEAQVNSSIDGILVVDNHGKKILQNQRCIDLWKIPQNIVEQNDDAVQVQYVMNRTKYPEQFVEKVTHLYAHPHEISHDEIEFKDGMFLDRYSAPVLGQDGTCYGRIWKFRDITERKRAEEELQESEKKYKAIFDGASEGILIADGKNKKFKYANPMICSMLGYGADELVRLSVNDIHPPEHLQEVIAVFESMARGENTISHSIPCLRKDGSVFFAEIKTANVIIDGIPCNVGFFTDVTERKRAAEELSAITLRQQAILAAVPDIIMEVDNNKIYTSVKQSRIGFLWQ